MSYTLLKIRKVWHYRFQVAGLRIQRSTREQSQARADLVAQKAYADAIDRANGRAPAPTLAQVAAEWLAVRAPTVSAAHRRNVDVFSRLHLYDLADLPISELSTARIETTRNMHLAAHAPASANQWLRVIKLVVNWAVKRDVIDRIPWRLTMLKVQKRPRSILPTNVTLEWFAAIDAATENAPAIGTAIRLMFGLGLRESEAAGARWEWIDWERKTYTPGITKGREAVPIPMVDWLIEHLSKGRLSEGTISPKTLPPGYARAAIRQANAACSVTGITPHRLRGTFATLLSEEGVPIQTIRAVMRHKSPLTTMNYLEVSVPSASRALDRIGAKIWGGAAGHGKEGEKARDI